MLRQHGPFSGFLLFSENDVFAEKVLLGQHDSMYLSWGDNSLKSEVVGYMEGTARKEKSMKNQVSAGRGRRCLKNMKTCGTDTAEEDTKEGTLLSHSWSVWDKEHWSPLLPSP